MSIWIKFGFVWVSKEYTRIFGKKINADLLFKKLRYFIHVKEITGDPGDENQFPTDRYIYALSLIV